jgi:hypothetical protein
MIERLLASLEQAHNQGHRPVRWVLGRIFARQLCTEYGQPVEGIRLILGLPVTVDDAPVGWLLVAK